MEKSEREKSPKRSNHLTFAWHDPYSTYVVILEVDDKGNPVCAEYGSKTYWYSYTEGDKEFVSVFKKVIRVFLDHNIDEFKKIRNHLNEEYYELVEQEINLAKTRSSSEYNF